MRVLTAIISILLIALAQPISYIIADTSSSVNDGLLIVVSFPNLVYDIEQLTCNGDIVKSIAPVGVDPHNYQLTPDNIELLRKADLIISTGHTPFEKSIEEMILKGEFKARLIVIPKIPGIRILSNPVLGTPNYHAPIYDPHNYEVFMKYVAEALGELRPECKDEYMGKLSQVLRKLQDLVENTPRLNYTAVADTPLTQYAVLWLNVTVKYLMVKEHGVPATPQDIEEIKSFLSSEKHVIAIITSPVKLPVSQQLEQLAQKYNVKTIYVPSFLLPSSTLSKLENISRQARSLIESLRIETKTVTSQINVEFTASLSAIIVLTVITSLLLFFLYRSGNMKLYTNIILLYVITITASIISLFTFNPRWIIVMVSASLVYGFLGPVIAARRLYFLASASPHAALLAAVLAIPLARFIGFGGEYFWAILVGILLIYFVGYLVYRGVDPDTATAVFVAFTASSSVMAIYYVLTHYPIETDIWAIIVGDPLLASWSSVFFSLAILLVVAVSVLLTHRENICLGVDRDYVRLAGVNIRIYDLLVFTLLAVATVALIKVVGFVLEHVLVLLPAAIAVTWSKSARQALLTSISVSLLAGLTGLYLAVPLNQAPAGTTGLILLAVYLAVLFKKRR